MSRAVPPTTQPGALVVSLDFELYWGVRDVVSLDAYRANLLGAREAIPRILELFARYEVHATWATVGFLFARSRDELASYLPAVRPSYRNARLSPYSALDGVGADERADPFHFAPSLIERIAATPHQEIASHTFSHFYCLEEGQTPEQLRADLEAALAIGRRFGRVIDSLVLPRNQWSGEYLRVLRELGVRCFRVNRNHWCYRSRSLRDESLPVRATRLLDLYAPVTGRTSSAWPPAGSGEPLQLEASLFLRPFDPRLARLDRLRRRRIGAELERAAREGRIFHLWWHPHNFGTHTEQNLAMLEGVLREAAELRERYDLQSLSMREVADHRHGRAATAQTVSESQ